MADTYKKLAQTQPGIAIAAIYTVAALTTAIIKHIRVSNAGAAAATIEFYHDGAVAANQILPPVSLAIGEWAEFDGTLLMEAADTLQAKASVAATLTVTVYGLERA